jgi:uncharacterized repeat protein (TIGR01451 family)
VTSVPLGSTVHDQATVTGTEFGDPSGDVSFRWFSNAECTGDSVDAGRVDLSEGVAHPSDPQTPASAGGYSFQATYEGDTNHEGSVGPCEPLTVTSVDLTITKTDGAARPVAGQGSFTYTLSVDNLGPSDAQDDATVVDVLPTEVTFLSFGTLDDGVTCDPPVGRTITCTLDKDLLDVADDPVEIPIEVTVKAGTPSGDITNETIVTSPDDEAPCVVTEDDITCDPSDTNDYADVVTPVTTIGGTSVETTPPAAAALAFTGSLAQKVALLGGLLLAAGAVVLLASRRRRKKAALGS